MDRNNITKKQITIKYEAEQTFQDFIRVGDDDSGQHENAGSRAIRCIERQ
jgi:hypothetical protein